ncbi:MAG: response regulator [Flammeovirgaceae bacterium]
MYNNEYAHLKVLLVEDNKINQLFIGKQLSNWNVSYEIADNGEKAIEKILSEEYHLILMDLYMPIIDGFEATRMLRQVYHQISVPIIALTASESVEDYQKAFNAGITDYLLKPIKGMDLYHCLSNYLFKLVPNVS